MKHTIYKIVAAVFLLSVGVSCTKWLNVQPEDRYTEDQIFSKSEGFEEALNGIYINLSSNALYGDNLTLTVPDIFAQYYKTNGSVTHNLAKLGAYDYADKSVVRPRIEAIWTNAYVAIANINKLLENIDKQGKQVLDPERLNTMKGELLGLRGFLHFDLLRFFGPVYDSKDSTTTAIPYYTELGTNIQPFIPANQVLDAVLKDVNAALPLLSNDPVRAVGYKFQNNQRFNYYAVLGAKARALLWRKDVIGANEAAKKVVDDAKLFPWIVGSKITADLQNPDRIFYTELLFSVYSNDLYNNYNKYFYYELATNILSGGTNQFTDKVFEAKTADYRYQPLWRQAPSGVSNLVFYKYADLANKKLGEQPQRNLIPLIRLSEMYYILAETEADQTKALDYLNKVLNARGLASLPSTVNIQTEVMKEYRKEFYGEGQLWYYYKRKKISSILSAQPTNNNGTIPSYAWVVPIPDDEFANR